MEKDTVHIFHINMESYSSPFTTVKIILVWIYLLSCNTVTIIIYSYNIVWYASTKNKFLVDEYTHNYIEMKINVSTSPVSTR